MNEEPKRHLKNMDVQVTSTSSDDPPEEPVLFVDTSSDKQPYFRLNSELSSKKNGKKIAEKKGGYLEGWLNLRSLEGQVKSMQSCCSTFPDPCGGGRVG